MIIWMNVLNINIYNIKKVFLCVSLIQITKKCNLNWIYLYEIDFYGLVQHMLMRPTLTQISDSNAITLKIQTRYSLNRETRSDRFCSNNFEGIYIS
jgi:hypothetical protein